MNQKSTATEHGHYHHHLHSSSGLNHEEPLDVLTHLSLPVYGTRKSSRRLLQQLNQNQSNDPQLVGLCNIDCQTNVSAQPSNSSTNELSDATDSVHSIIGDISNLPSSTKVTNTTSQSTQNAAGSTTLNGSVHSSQSGVSIASSSGVTSNTSTAKHQRKWEMWQADDTRWFFEALNEHGKDFNAIHHYMTTKLKKKGTPEDLMKNKEQIRCYFNRQWNKVSGLLDQNNNLLKDVDKTAQQLYAMINYGEIWKKFNFRNDLKFDSKLKTHLNDMIFNGHTFMKIGKGKNFKLKTPTCKALKRLHNLNDSDSIAQHLPKDVTIELLPASNYAWLRVQSVAHNPTLRVKCTPQKRLATLIEFLEQLWNVTARRNHLCELHTGRSLDLTKQQSNMRATPGKEDRRLRLRPHPALTKNMTSVRLLRHQTHQTHSQSDISLNAYLSKANSWPENKKKRNLHNLSSHGCSKKANREESSVKKNDTNANEQSKPGPTIAAQSELSPDSTEKSNISPIIETVRSLNALNNMVSSSCEDPMRSESPEFTNERSSDEESLRNTRMKPSEEDAIPPPGVTIGEWLSGNVKTDTLLNQEPDKSTESNYGYIKSPLNTKSAFNNEEELCRTIDMNVLRNGWTIEQTDELTIGELCLIFKSKGTLILQYDWDFVQSMPVKSVLSRLISAATIALNHFHKEHEEFAPVNPISSPVKHSRLPSLNTNSRKTKRFRSLDMSVNVAADEIKQSCSSTGPSVVRVEDLADKDKELSDTRTDKDSHKAERFVIPNSPAPRPPTAKQPPKNRIVDEALLQEAKDQLNGKFTTRRLSRKPTIVKPQQYHLSLNANQILGTNLRQLLAGKGISNQTYVSASTDSPSIISMIAAAAATSQSSSSSNNMFIRQNPTSNKQLSSAKSQPSKCTTAISVPEPINIQPATIEISNPVANSISTVTTIQPCGSNDEQNRLLKSNKTNNKVIADELPIGPVKSNVDASIATSIDSTVEKSSDLYPRPPSPPSLSCLLDMSLGDSGALFNDSTDKFFFSSLMQSSSSSFKSGSLSTPTKTQIEQQEQDCQQTIPAAITPFQMHFQRLNEPTVPPTEVGSFDSVNQSTKSSINQMLNLDSNSLTGSSSAWLYNSNADLSLNNLFDCSLDHHSSAPSCSVTTNQSNELQTNESLSISSLISDSSTDLISKFVNLSDKLTD